jgi:cobalt-zinc-cadmium efflux system membrane fusion protein
MRVAEWWRPENCSMWRTLNSEWFWLAVAMILAGCQPSQPPVSKVAASPAKTTHPVAESGLNTIELTEEAVKRLGLQTAAAETRTMVRTRPYGADVVLPTGASVIVSAPLAGTLKPADGPGLFQVGQRIPEGTALLKLLPLLSPERAVLTPAERIRLAEAKNALAQSQIDAEGQVQQATVQMDAAQVALARAEKLLKDMAGSARAVDEAKAQLQITEKAYAAAKTRKQQIDSVTFDEAAGTLESIPIPSPLTGIIRTTLVRPGEMVAAAAPLFEVVQDDMLWVKVPVYVGELDELDPTRTARLSILNGRHSETDLFAKPAELPPTAVPLAAAVDLYFELPNPDRKYQPGQKISAHLTLKGEARQVAVPWSAIYHDIYGGQWVYEQTSDRHFVRRRVEVGWVDGEWAAVTRGLQPGVKVVTAGAAEIAGTEFGFAK